MGGMSVHPKLSSLNGMLKLYPVHWPQAPPYRVPGHLCARLEQQMQRLGVVRQRRVTPGRNLPVALSFARMRTHQNCRPHKGRRWQAISRCSTPCFGQGEACSAALPAITAPAHSLACAPRSFSAGVRVHEGPARVCSGLGGGAGAGCGPARRKRAGQSSIQFRSPLSAEGTLQGPGAKKQRLLVRLKPESLKVPANLWAGQMQARGPEACK